MNNLKPTRSWLSFDNQPVLREKCKVVDPNNLSNDDLVLIDKMMSYVDNSFANKAAEYDIVPGIAIAANQLGIAKQIVYIHFMEGKVEHKYLLLNPKIVSTSVAKTYIDVGEGCLSVNDEHYGPSLRYKKINVIAYDYFNKKEITINADGLLAICLQHEIDHLNGLLYYDRIVDDVQDAKPYIQKSSN